MSYPSDYTIICVCFGLTRRPDCGRKREKKNWVKQPKSRFPYRTRFYLYFFSVPNRCGFPVDNRLLLL
jgi:hypothetical protein